MPLTVMADVWIHTIYRALAPLLYTVAYSVSLQPVLIQSTDVQQTMQLCASFLGLCMNPMYNCVNMTLIV
jgi:hypothetical protein